ncbi:MAG: MFS transporter [Acidobacteria bacterium]|nr:MFS transporter [Acidobacteriota bacterium]
MKENTSASASSGYWKLLRYNASFRKVWLSQIVSELGDWLNFVALVQIIKTFSGQAQDTGWLVILQMLPMFLLSPFAGMVADRFDRRKVMIACDLIRFVVVLGLLTIRHPNQLWLLYVLSTLQFSVTAFFEPARAAIIPNVAKGEELIHANALSGVTWSTILAIGGALGGVISGLYGNQVAFVVDAASFLVSAGLILRLKVERDIHTTTEGGKIDNIGSGFSEIFPYLRKNPRVLAVLLVKAGISTTAGGVWLLSVIYGQSVFPIGQDGAISVGILYGVHGMGALLGAIFTGWLFRTSILSAVYIILAAFSLRGLFFWFWSISPNLGLVSLSIIFVTACGSLLWVLSTTLLQKLTEDHIRGRLFAIDNALFTLSMAISVSLSGRVIDVWRVSPQQATFYNALAAVVVGVLWLLVVIWWRKFDKEVVLVAQ